MSQERDNMRETLSLLMERQGAREQMLCSVLEKAMGGDMKAIEFIRELLGEEWKPVQEPVRIELGQGVEPLCK